MADHSSAASGYTEKRGKIIKIFRTAKTFYLFFLILRRLWARRNLLIFLFFARKEVKNSKNGNQKLAPCVRMIIFAPLNLLNNYIHNLFF